MGNKRDDGNQFLARDHARLTSEFGAERDPHGPEFQMDSSLR